MDYQNITGFNFTHAFNAPGAWLRDASGCVEWVDYAIIKKELGAEWYERQRRAQGMFTGIWVNVKTQAIR